MIILIILVALVSSVVFLRNNEICIWEYLTLVGVSSLVIVIVFSICNLPFDNDIYFKSGRLITTQYHPEFVEEYQQPHTVCTSTGKTTTCTTYYTTEHVKHRKYWTATDSLGQTYDISEKFHQQIKHDFRGRQVTTRPNKCTHGGSLPQRGPLSLHLEERSKYI